MHKLSAELAGITFAAGAAVPPTFSASQQRAAPASALYDAPLEVTIFRDSELIRGFSISPFSTSATRRDEPRHGAPGIVSAA